MIQSASWDASSSALGSAGLASAATVSRSGCLRSGGPAPVGVDPLRTLRAWGGQGQIEDADRLPIPSADAYRHEPTGRITRHVAADLKAGLAAEPPAGVHRFGTAQLRVTGSSASVCRPARGRNASVSAPVTARLSSTARRPAYTVSLVCMPRWLSANCALPQCSW